MGTKNNPAPNDCYTKAEADEPLFVLLARDPVAGHLVSIWAKLRAYDYEAAKVVFDDMVMKHWRKANIADTGPENYDSEKVLEAMNCSAAMFAWIKEHRPERSLNK